MIRTEQEVLRMARRAAMQRLRTATRHMPVAARRAANPLRWFRRYPVATIAVTVAAAATVSAIAVRTYAESDRGGRSRWARRLRGQEWLRWTSSVGSELLKSLRRALVGAVVAQFTAASPTPSDEGYAPLA